MRRPCSTGFPTPQTPSTLLVPRRRYTRSATINNRWLTTATGKLGYAWDRVLVYAKGGGAWVGTNNPTITANGVPASLPVLAQQLGLDGRCRCRVGVRGQLVGPGRVRLYRADRTRALLSRAHRHQKLCGRRNQLQQPQHPNVHRRHELQVRRRLVVTARTYFLPRLGLLHAPGSARGFFYGGASIGTASEHDPEKWNGFSEKILL